MPEHKEPRSGEVDLLLSGGSIITMDESRRIIRDGSVAILDDRIVAVGKREDLASRYNAKRTVDTRRRVIAPGFVNSHIHFYHQMHRGMSAHWLDGHEWSNFVHEKVAPILTSEDEIWAARLVLLELMKSGSTSFLAAGSYDPYSVLDVLPEVGLRGFEGRRTYDMAQLGHVWRMDDTETAVRENAAVMEAYADNLGQGLIQPCVNVVGLGRCSDELLVASKELADKYGALLNLHQCAFPEEVQSIRERTGTTPVHHLHNLGVLGPRTVLVHMVNVYDSEIEVLAETGTHVSFNPGTAIRLTYGLAQSGKFPEMIDAGVNVALGTDSGDCANFMDIVRSMYLAAVLFKDSRRDATLMGPEVALEMATVNGARALGMEDMIGSLESGKKADIVLFDSDAPEWQPMYCEPYNLVLSASGGSVDSVLVDGRVVMEGRQVLTIDESEVMERIRKLSRGIEARSGVNPPTKWPVT